MTVFQYRGTDSNLTPVTVLSLPVPPVLLLMSAKLQAYQPSYHDLPPPWQPGDAQVLVVAFQPMVLTTFTTPLL